MSVIAPRHVRIRPVFVKIKIMISVQKTIIEIYSNLYK